MLEAPLQILMHVGCLTLVALFSRMISPYVHNKNTYSDKGLPCQSPQEGVISPFGSPLKRMEKEIDLIHIITWLIQSLSNPNLLIIYSRKVHSTLS